MNLTRTPLLIAETDDEHLSLPWGYKRAPGGGLIGPGGQMSRRTAERARAATAYKIQGGRAVYADPSDPKSLHYGTPSDSRVVSTPTDVLPKQQSEPPEQRAPEREAPKQQPTDIGAKPTARRDRRFTYQRLRFGK